MVGRRSAFESVGRVAAISALLVAVAACGGDDDDGAASAETDDTTASAGTDDATAPAETDDTTAPAETDDTTAPAETDDTTAPMEPATEDCSAEDTIEELRLGNSVPPASMNPLNGQASGSGYNTLVAMYGELMHFDPATGELVPGFAESVVPNDDLTEWTLTLKDGVTFGSGNPLNTEAVKWNIEFVAAPDSTSASADAARRITEMEIISDLEMTFTLDEPYGDFPVVLGAPIGSVVDPAVAEEFGQEALDAGTAPGAGAGAYELETWDATSAVVKRKADWWGPMPCVDRFAEVFFAEAQTRNDAFLLGEVDAIYLRGPTPHRLLREEVPENVEGFTQVVNNGSNLMINTSAGGVERITDVRVRRAIGLALDHSVVNERVLEGAGRSSKAFLDESSTYYTPEIEPLPYDPDEARRLLDEAKADGFDGTLVYPSNSTPEAVDTALVYEAQLEAVGFDVERDSTYDTAGIIGTILFGSQDYDIMTLALGTFDSDILGELNKRVEPFSGYASPEWDAAKDALASASTVEEKQAALVEVSRVWNEDVPWVTLDHHEVSVFWPDDITGFGFSKAGIVLIESIRPA